MEFLEVIVLVLSFVVLLILGVPIAFSIGVAALLTMLVSIAPDAAFTTMALLMATSLYSFALIAIQFFILAGLFMKLRNTIDKALYTVLIILMSAMVINVLWQVASRY
ncbi:MAG: TRAP transporter large permease subunit, partial [Pontibacter sp.]|nr:TRAP transporter large permease subunit [Pontibacter sp.]